METIWIVSPPEPDISGKSELKFDVKREPEHQVTMENQIETDIMTTSEMKTEIQVKSEPEADIEMALESDLKTEFVEIKTEDLEVRM